MLLVRKDVRMSDQHPIKPLGIAKGERIGTRTIAQYSAEQTAEFLDGGELGNPAYVDPVLAAALQREDAALRKVLFNVIVPTVAKALDKDSPNTASRLRELAADAKAGNARSSQLLGAVLGVVLTRGLRSP